MSEPARNDARFARPPYLSGVELVSVEYSERTFPEHSHAEWVVGAIMTGCEALTVGGKTYEVQTGQVLRLHPDQPHANRTTGGEPVTLRQAFWVWLRIAMLSFGGPAGQIAVMHRILVDEKRWIGEQRYRKLDGTPVALEDACWHRLVPLSIGTLQGDDVRCGYHGMVFGPNGRCTHMPTQETINPSACVRAFPIEQRHRFLWVFLGAPFIERLRGNAAVAAALSAITAAVVGVVLNLAVWFALHTLFRETAIVTIGPVRFDAPILASMDPWAALLAAGAAVAVFVLRANVIVTLLATSAAGIVLHFLGLVA